jgi:hypothetical protein
MTTRKSNAHELEQVTRRLAELLIEAEPLARRLSEEGHAAKYRSRLRELVGEMRYFELTNLLNNLCSERAWQIARARSETERRRLAQPLAPTIAFDGTRIRRLADRDEP